MGKHKRHQQHQARRHPSHDDDPLPSSAFDTPSPPSPPPLHHPQQQPPHTTFALLHLRKDAGDAGLRHSLYQQSVQSPKGDISYMHKFFLTYIGGRTPLHLYEDFCGTALICAEWVRGDARRTALGIDLDEETLSWGLHQNMEKLSFDACSRIRLLCGDVLHPLSRAQVMKLYGPKDPVCEPSADPFPSSYPQEAQKVEDRTGYGGDILLQTGSFNEKEKETLTLSGEAVAESTWPRADLVCALNYSCCCLHKRTDLVAYFSRVFKLISKEGGVFILDIYGGTSSECAMKVRRHYAEFTYIWEQEDFDVVNRTTRISLHFQLNRSNRVLRHAFTYRWRLWTLPELRDGLQEAGFNSVHVWIRDTSEVKDGDELDTTFLIKFEEVSSFLQQPSWNAYVVAVKQRTLK